MDKEKQDTRETIQDNQEVMINKYIDSMTDKEKIALEIARSHLGSSFDIEKCIGFKKFYEKNKNK